MIPPRLALFFLFVTASHYSAAQETPSGIFLTTKFRKDCQNLLSTRDKKVRVCTTPRPIITPEEFAGVSDIKTSEENNFSAFKLIFSQQGYDKLKGIIDQLSEIELVLVVDNTVVGFIKNKNQLVNKSLQIDGTAHSEELKLVHKQLLEEINH